MVSWTFGEKSPVRVVPYLLCYRGLKSGDEDDIWPDDHFLARHYCTLDASRNIAA
jgi:hypothetical protein